MSELLVIGFEGKHRAAEVLDQLEAMRVPFSIDLEDAVAVYRTDDGRLRMDGSLQPTTRDGAVSGALFGGFIGAILLAPFTAGASAAVAAAGVATGAVTLGLGGAMIGAEDATEWKETSGISDDFVKEVGGLVQPGQSAVFVLANAADPARVAEQFRGYGGRLLHTTLSPEADRKFQQLLTPTIPTTTAR